MRDLFAGGEAGGECPPAAVASVVPAVNSAVESDECLAAKKRNKNF